MNVCQLSHTCIIEDSGVTIILNRSSKINLQMWHSVLQVNSGLCLFSSTICSHDVPLFPLLALLGCGCGEKNCAPCCLRRAISSLLALTDPRMASSSLDFMSTLFLMVS